MQSYQKDADIEDLIKNHPDMAKDLANDETDLPTEEQDNLEDELITIMHQLFLAAKDKEWVDYEVIDNDE